MSKSWLIGNLYFQWRIHKKILQHLRGRFGDNPRKLVEQIIRKCDVFKIREDLYIFCVLLLGVGWKILVAKTGKLVRPPKITTIEKNMREWGVWPYYLAFSRGHPKVPEVGIELPKVNCGVLKTKCKLPSELLIADSFTKNLIAERRDEKNLSLHNDTRSRMGSSRIHKNNKRR